ncbi:hypothetical protein FRC18_006323 [Serendipita sp. 400]|nr:hypothetical protein FRC18_006323 [Serendipita sp. 400]
MHLFLWNFWIHTSSFPSSFPWPSTCDDDHASSSIQQQTTMTHAIIIITIIEITTTTIIHESCWVSICGFLPSPSSLYPPYLPPLPSSPPLHRWLSLSRPIPPFYNLFIP